MNLSLQYDLITVLQKAVEHHSLDLVSLLLNNTNDGNILTIEGSTSNEVSMYSKYPSDLELSIFWFSKMFAFNLHNRSG